jgi:hypothetical protein
MAARLEQPNKVDRNAQAIADALMLQIKKMRRDAERVRGSMGMESADYFLDQQYAAASSRLFGPSGTTLCKRLGRRPSARPCGLCRRSMASGAAGAVRRCASEYFIRCRRGAGRFGAMFIFGTAANALPRLHCIL